MKNLKTYQELFENGDYYSKLKNYLNDGKDVDRILFGESLLMKGARENDLKTVKLLIDAGASWDFTDKDGYSFIDYLSHSDSREILKTYPEKYEEYLRNKDVNKFKI